MKLGRFSWLRLTLQLRGSVVPAVYDRVLWCGLFGLLISALHFYQLPVSSPILGTAVPSIVLGLLLVFRTNTAYERFWEGRRLWGELNNNIRNLSRQIWIGVATPEFSDHQAKVSTIKLLGAFAVATKRLLRSQGIDAELEQLLDRPITNLNHPPLEIALWISDYLQRQHSQGCINVYQLQAMQTLLDGMVSNCGGCERILRTPMPLAYAIHLKQLLMIYCLLLPFYLVAALGWMTGPIVALISFTLFGIEEIGIEIENPFGYDANDLPLDAICTNICRNLDYLMEYTPSTAIYLNKTTQHKE